MSNNDTNKVIENAAKYIWGSNQYTFIKLDNSGPFPSENELQIKNARMCIDNGDEFAILRTGYSGYYATILAKVDGDFIKFMLNYDSEKKTIYYS